MPYRITVDVGGTFTDVVVSDGAGLLEVGKAPTTPERAFHGIRRALAGVAERLDMSDEDLLRATDLFVYSTTRSTNAIIERKTARTALMVTAGFPDILVMREGGKTNPFDFELDNPPPYVPRHRTFEIPERIAADGSVVTPLDEDAVRRAVRTMADDGVEAVAVSLLWSFVNGSHEARIGEILAAELPDVPFTLSHELAPVIREYRRASATAIDASLKPLMAAHLRDVREDLFAHGFGGEMFGATMFGGVMNIDDLVRRPIYSAGSGPALAPVAALTYSDAEAETANVVVCDMGGTSFDVGLVRDGRIKFTNETWLGGRFIGHLVAIPSVDVRSIGAGGGSVVWVDPGGLLRVGPHSAGAEPGPACYGRGGTEATVTDAAAVLGYLDPEWFLGGRMRLDLEAATRAIDAVAGRLGLTTEETAAAILDVSAEHMVAAIREATVNEGIDPRDCAFVSGGGAAGISIGRIVQELGCRSVIVPRTAGTLSAVGGQYSDVIAQFSVSHTSDSGRLDEAGVEAAFVELDGQVASFTDRLHRRGIDKVTVEYLADARYVTQLWDLEIEVPQRGVRTGAQLDELVRRFNAQHERVFAINHPGEHVEFLAWKARVIADVGGAGAAEALRAHGAVDPQPVGAPSAASTRRAYFPSLGWTAAPVHSGGSLAPGATVRGPAIVAEETSTLVVRPGHRVRVTGARNYLLEVTP